VVTRVRCAGGAVTDAVISGFGVSDRAVTRDVTDLIRSATDTDTGDLEAALRPGTEALARDVVDTSGDTHGSQGYRRRLFAVLAARELARAYRRSTEGQS
jgi:2-furoyl-CoA dehydrogenase FAD binding subunit